MDSLPDTASIPHMIQVYSMAPDVKMQLQTPQIVHISHPTLQAHSQGKISYQQTITDTIVSEQEDQIQSQIIMSCQQTHMQSIQPLTNVTQKVVTQDVSQLQFTSHVILPQQRPVIKQELVIVDRQQHYYEEYILQQDQDCVITKLKLGTDNTHNMPPVHSIESIPDNPVEVQKVKQTEDTKQLKKRTRNPRPNPNKWACNVRKMKHQRGEAYISRRGVFVPERKIVNTKDCLTSCKFKCNQRISDSDRELIFKAFYSLNANEKKHFLLNTTERHKVRNPGIGKRKYSYKYFFLVRAVRYTVCKDFYLGTLAISQKPVYNVHLGKSETNLPKPDGRGHSINTLHTLPTELKERVRKHIQTFKTVDLKPIKLHSNKKQYLEIGSIRKMYTMYVGECKRDNVCYVKESMYRKILKQEFNASFKKGKNDKLCVKCKEPIKKK